LGGWFSIKGSKGTGKKPSGGEQTENFKKEHAARQEVPSKKKSSQSQPAGKKVSQKKKKTNPRRDSRNGIEKITSSNGGVRKSPGKKK